MKKIKFEAVELVTLSVAKNTNHVSKISLL